MALAPGLVKTALVDDSGLISNPWAKYLEEIANGTNADSDGNSSAAQIAFLLSAVASLGAQLAALRARVLVLELGVQM
jgi:hypothetical protein